MNVTPAQEAIANLIALAESGEIDPWNVSVIGIIDRFLAELGLSEVVEHPLQSQPDLPQSGQAFLWASMLVLLKADTLELMQTETEELEAELLDSEAEFVPLENSRSLPPNLEEHLRRRTSIRSFGSRRVTLPELIEQLEHIAAEIEALATDSRPKRTKSSRSAAVKAIAQLAHNENLTELALQLERFLCFNVLQLAPERQCLEWEQLLQLWQSDRSTELESHSDRAGIFWALLLLSAQSKVELYQEEFYQDLSIRPLN
ncbi:segregation/condensation protein A [Myxosarcina sp. GI1]|uniref:segregation/condensation protein A n=1 Tax=Myxosarcina sp. GI1 TaxID=1541065 RepID=UPI00056A643B|nr:segregation/condensation protein A [Myxosarcina sp. GI1]